MRLTLLDCLRCVSCEADRLEIIRRDDVRTMRRGPTEEEILVRGVLGCPACQARYPVLEEAPRLLNPDSLTPEERAVLENQQESDPTGRSVIQISGDDRNAIVRSCILRDYGNPTGGPSLRRALDEVEYQRFYPERRRYQMEFLGTRLGSSPRAIADIGGGSGGNLLAAEGVFSYSHAVVADLSTDWPVLYQAGDRRIAYVRADATRLPFRTRCFDLVISSFLIEHVKDWTAVLQEIGRIGSDAFVSFGPNRSFPFEIGHVDAPLAHSLPPPLDSLAVLCWGYATGNRRSMAQIRKILDEMNYLSSREYYRYCRQAGFRCENLFPALFVAWAETSHSGIRGWLGRRPRLAGGVARGLAGAGLEPNIYSLVRRHRPDSESREAAGDGKRALERPSGGAS